MKKMRFGSILLTIAMLVTMFVVPVSAEELELVYTEDFSKYSTADELTNNGGFKLIQSNGTVSIESSVDAYEKVLKLETTNAWGQAGVDKSFNGTYNAGKIGIEYSVKPGSGVGAEFMLLDSKDRGLRAVIFRDDSKLSIEHTGDNMAFGNYTLDKWYNVKIVLDFNTKNLDIEIKDKDDQIVVIRKGYDFSTKISDLSAIRLKAQSAGTGTSYYDNVKVYMDPTEIEVPPEFPYTEDFSGYDNNIDTLKSKGGFTTAASTEGKISLESLIDGHTDVLKLEYPEPSNKWGYVQVDKTFSDTYNTGKLGFEFSVKPGGGVGGATQMLFKDQRIIIFRDNGTISLKDQGDNNTFGSYTPGQWYDVKLVFNFDKKLLDVEVVDAGGNSVGLKKGFDFSEDAGFQALNSFRLQVAGNAYDTPSYFDDVKIYMDPTDIEAPSELPFEENFDDYATIADLEANGKGWRRTVKGELTEIRDVDNGKAVYVGLTQDTDNTVFEKIMQTPLADAKYEFSFDVKPGVNILTHIFARTSNDVLPLVVFKEDGNAYVCNTGGKSSAKIGSFTAGTWYNVVVKINMNAKTVDVKITDKQSGKAITKAGVNYEEFTGKTFASFSSLAFQVWKNQDSGSYFDNFSLKELEKKPEMSGDRITFFVGDIATETLVDVPSTTNKIVLDFGTKMKESTMNSINIVLKNKTTNQNVSYKGTSNGTKFIITFENEAVLGANTEYELAISENVENTFGTALGENVKIEFNTGSGVFSASLMGVKYGEEDVTKLNQIAKNNMITTSINYANTTEEAQRMVLIYAYYSGDTLIRTMPVNILKTADVQSTVITDSHIVQDLTGVDKVKILLWDSWEMIIPLSDAITLAE